MDEFDDLEEMTEDDIQALTQTDVKSFTPEPETKKDIVTAEPNKLATVETPSRVDDQNADYDFARTKAYEVINQGSDALNDLISFAKSSQSPRAFEVVAKMIDTLTNSSEKLLNFHEKMKQLENDGKGGKSNKQEAGTINNIVFNGTTDELFEAINKKKK